jgi:hypothetical protein
MTTQAPPPTTEKTPQPGECAECQAPAGMHRPLCPNGNPDQFAVLLNCLVGRHTFTNTAPTGEKPLWECRHCGEPRITATGSAFSPPRNRGAA